jgi:hypothetical protein
MEADPQSIKALIAAELSCVADKRVVDFVAQRLVEPTRVLRIWHYGDPGQRFPCWTVLTSHGDGIAYCEHGFGPHRPWGLVWTEGDDLRQSIGMDSDWFDTFLQAVKESALADLPVWRVFQSASGSSPRPITEEADWNTTWKEVERLRTENPTMRYDCETTAL